MKFAAHFSLGFYFLNKVINKENKQNVHFGHILYIWAAGIYEHMCSAIKRDYLKLQRPESCYEIPHFHTIRGQRVRNNFI